MKRIGVIGGGFSSEYSISLKSVQTIIDNFPQEYTPIKIILSKENCSAQWNGQNYEITLSDKGFYADRKWIEIDAYWIYIHGNPGENGRLQAYFEMYNIPYIGSKMLASALSFDKWYCNQFLKNFKIPIAQSILLQQRQQIVLQPIIDTIGFPCFVKPTNSGSSYGISKVYTMKDLEPAIEIAFEHGDQIVIESFLDGREVTCAVYKTTTGTHTLPLAEIVSENDFFDYNAKYLGQSQEIIPAQISEEQSQQVKKLSENIYHIMQLRSIVRMDFMLVNDIAHLIEINTTPGFSSASLVPQMIQKNNQTIQSFLSNVIEYELKNI